MKKILLIDGLNFIYRACIKFGGPSTEPDEVVFVYNFFRNLRPIIEQFKPEKIFFVLEGHPKFRYDLYPEYKANRIIKTASKQEANETFHKAKREILKLLENLPITIAKANDFECDDVIATLATEMKNDEVTIISNDSDYIQLLQKGLPNLKIFNSIKKTFMEAPQYPYVIWKSLNGDKSDNISSLLTPKKALDTVNSPEKFDKFLSLEENRANFSINRDLIEFRNVPLEDISYIEYTSNFENLKQEFEKAKYVSITNDKSWDKFVNTFSSVK